MPALPPSDTPAEPPFPTLDVPPLPDLPPLAAPPFPPDAVPPAASLPPVPVESSDELLELQAVRMAAATRTREVLFMAVSEMRVSGSAGVLRAGAGEGSGRRAP
jgi:hypothetical protein